MAKYEVVSAGADGQYTVKEHLDVALISGKISQLQTEITTLQTRNTEIDGQIPPLETELQSVQTQIETALTTTPPDSEKAQKLTKYSFTVSSNIGNLQRQKTDNNLKISQNNKVVIRLQAVLDQQNIVQSAVCIDGDDTLTAGLIVGSIELNRFPRDKSSGKVLIRPGAEASYNNIRDGITRNAISMGASELFVNQALLPPAQAYLPRFVAATVDSIDSNADTISATPYIEPNNHPATWWEGATPVRMPASSYTNIPVVYKTCNAGAFTVGDKVVVEYIAGQPTVVGFVDNPAPCAAGFLVVLTPADLVTSIPITMEADYEIDWGDGVFVSHLSTDSVSEVPTGDITIRTNNIITHYRFKDYFTSIDVQKSSTITSLNQSHDGMSKLTSFAIADTSNVTNFNRAWSGCSGLTSFPLIDITSGLTFYRAWFLCSGLTSFPSLGFSNATDLSYAFYNCTSIINLPAILPAPGANFAYAFYQCASLRCISEIDTTAATSKTNMFIGTGVLRYPDKSEQSALGSPAGLNYVNNQYLPCPDFYAGSSLQGAAESISSGYFLFVMPVGQTTPPPLSKVTFGWGDYEILTSGSWYDIGGGYWRITVPAGSSGNGNDYLTFDANGGYIYINYLETLPGFNTLYSHDGEGTAGYS